MLDGLGAAQQLVPAAPPVTRYKRQVAVAQEKAEVRCVLSAGVISCWYQLFGECISTMYLFTHHIIRIPFSHVKTPCPPNPVATGVP